MTQDPNATAMQRYHDRFDSALYHDVGELLASNLRLERDDDRIVSAMSMLQDTALELCGHTGFSGAWLRYAVFCGQNSVSIHVLNRIIVYLRRFGSADDARLEDFEGTAKAMLLAYSGLDDLRTATAHANGVHGWRGRMAYELLAASDLLAQAAIQLLQHGDDAYIREKLRAGLTRITGAMYEAIRHSDQPSLYNFRSTYFPDERDGR